MEFLLVLAILVAVVFVVTGPLRRPRPERAGGRHYRRRRAGDEPELDGDGSPAAADADFEREAELGELEAARAAKYREIRDTQLDYDTGKLSRADFEALDSGLRSEALQILRRIDDLGPPAPAEPADAGPGEPE